MDLYQLKKETKAPFPLQQLTLMAAWLVYKGITLLTLILAMLPVYAWFCIAVFVKAWGGGLGTLAFRTDKGHNSFTETDSR